ncbi:MAG: hypothetical protein ACK4J2_07520 [Sulfurihydrogenibium azorense]|uniref:hypothetical protein n=1 Tax=Sulfurihydrogenibium azorense TaxID=309806 RepID=UPI00391B69A8
MERELKEFIEKNKENLSKNLEPAEFIEFITQSKLKVKEVDNIKDNNKKAIALVNTLFNELKEKEKIYTYLESIYTKLTIAKEKANDIELKEILQFENVITKILENLYYFTNTPLQDYYYKIKNDLSLPIAELEKFLNPVTLKETITIEIVSEISEKLSIIFLKEKKEIENLDLPEDQKKKAIKEYEEIIRYARDFISKLKNQEVILFYFYHDIKNESDIDKKFINDLITEYIKEKTKVDYKDIGSFHNVAIIRKDIQNSITEIENKIEIQKEFREDGTLDLIPLGTFTNYIKAPDKAVITTVFDPKIIYKWIFDKFKKVADNIKQKKDRKEKETELFYKTYNRNKTQIYTLHIIDRNNPVLLTPEKLSKEQELAISSYWGNFIIQATKDDIEVFDPADIKNIITILSIEKSYAEHLKKQKEDQDDIVKQLVIEGIYIPLSLIAELREITKRKKNYDKILESIDKAQKLQIKGNLSTDLGKAIEITKAFSIISEYDIITFTNKTTINIKLSPTIAELLINNKGRGVNRKLLNRIDNNLLPLYFFLDNMRLNKNIKEKTISKQDLLINSRLTYGKTAETRPDKLDKYLKEKLNKLKQGILISKDYKEKIIKDWEKTELHNGEEGIRIIFEDPEE